MQNFLQFSSVVDSVRSGAGSAVKSVQRTFEEQALKAAGLGEEEEVLYRLNKHAQAYLRAADAMQEAAEKLAQDFTEAFEDVALRDIAKKFQEGSGAICAKQLSSLKVIADPIRQACDTDNYVKRQQLVSKAFVHFLKVSLDSCSATSTLVTGVRASAEEVCKKLEQPKAVNVTAPVQTAPDVSSPVKASTPPESRPRLERRATAPNPTTVSFDDMFGESSSNQINRRATADLLDFGLDEKPNTPINASSINGTTSGYGTSSPLEHVGASNLSFDFGIGGGSKEPPSTNTVTNTFDFGLDPGIFNGTTPNPSAPTISPSAPTISPAAAPDLGGLGDLSWPTKEDEDESCIKARVESWQKDKNLRAMLVSLHEVAPSSSGWTGAQLNDVTTAADVKNVYRRAILAVHPDKNQRKPGEKILAHLVFQALREQWTVFNTS